LEYWSVGVLEGWSVGLLWRWGHEVRESLDRRISGMRFFSTIVLIICLLLPQSLSADDGLQDILDGIKKRYGLLPGLAVPYERDVVTRSMAMLDDQMKTDLATGIIHFKPPHFLKVEQVTPKPEVVITDGDTLWWYIPGEKRVYRYPAHKLGRELRLLADIFQGLLEVEERFEVQLREDEGKTNRELTLRPTPPWQEIDYIDISVTRETHRIREVEIHNYLGGFTRFVLGDSSVRADFKDDFFGFTVPEGVEVIEE
jgi:outer membrane lipoprotein-sorting protein